MLLDIIREGLTAEGIIQLGLYIIIILISISVHELFHGYVAYRCGDATARNLGRLTMNPLVHLDPVGTIMMLVFGFGYARPVPVNPRNFNHYRRDTVFVSLAGPVSNLIMAFIGGVLYGLTVILLFVFNVGYSVPMDYLMFFLINFMYANVSLFVFNLLPIPPLDGSRIVSTILPGKWAFYYLKYERYIMLVVLLLLWQGAFDGILSFLAGHVYDGLMWVVDLIFTPILNMLIKGM